MCTNLQRLTPAYRWFQVLAVVLTLALLPGCGGCGKKDEPPAVMPTAPPAAEKAELSTVDVLRLMPESAMAAMAIPNLNGTYEKAVQLAKRLAPDPQTIDTAISDAVKKMADALKAPAAASFAEIAKTKGIDISKPMGIFVDMTPMVKAIQEKAAQPKPQAAPAEEPATEAAPAEKPASESPPEAPKAEGEKPAEETSKDASEDVELTAAVEMIDLTPPSFALVVSCSDPKAVEAAIKEALAQSPELASAKPEESDADGVRIYTYAAPPCAQRISYFLVDTWLVSGNSLDLVKGVAARLKTPAEVKYGTEAFPANESDQIIQLVRLDQIKTLMEGIVPLMEWFSPGMATVTAMQKGMMEESLKAYSGRDPVIATFSWNDQKMEFLSRVDLQAHPELAQFSGPAQPLRLAALLPESTLALLSIRFNEQTKANLQKTMMSGSEGNTAPAIATAMSMGPMVLGMIGDELALGVTGQENGIPKALLLVGLSNADQTKGMLEGFGVPIASKEQHAGVDIMQAPIPMPVSVYYAFPEQTLMISTDLPQLKSSIDLLKAGIKSNLFQTLQPALDPGTPRYGALFLKGALIDQVVKPALEQFQPDAPQELIPPAFDKAIQVIREVRVTQDLVNNHQEARMTVYLN